MLVSIQCKISLAAFSPDAYISSCSYSSWTNRLIAAKDHASVQLNVARVNADGVYTGESDVYALAGYIRGKGEADMAITELARQAEAKRVTA